MLYIPNNFNYIALSLLLINCVITILSTCEIFLLSISTLIVASYIFFDIVYLTPFLCAGSLDSNAAAVDLSFFSVFL